MKAFWDDRYGKEAFAYGTEPNDYLKSQLSGLNVGTILFPAEGEGRNAVFAAKLGWQVSAFDMSIEGKKKALQLAEAQGVKIDYQVGTLADLHFGEEQFDAIGLIYAHFSADLKSAYLQTFDQFLRKGGFIIFEAFSKKHIEYIAKNEKVGGPKDLDILYSVEELLRNFPDYEIIELVETEVELREGLYHNGCGSVIRFVGRKK